MEAAPPSTPRDGALERGSLFAERYRVVRCLKKGGMGSVFQVIDERTDRLRALKLMQPEIARDPEMRARFEKEASIIGRVRSDHLVEVTDAGVAAPSTPFLVMDLLEGEDLGSYLEAKGALAPGEVVELLEQVARGLDRVHAEGVVHRDVKPENLFLSRRDDGSQLVKVLDFGVAKVLHESGDLSTTRSLGTPLYMAPEQLTGDGTIGPAADLYGLAHVAFHLLCGRPYWHEEARSASNAYTFMNVVLRGAPERASVRAARRGHTLPATFDRWFAKATEARPARRFTTAAEQIRELRSALGLDATMLFEGAHASEAVPPADARRRAGLAPKVALGAVAACGVIALVAFGVRREPTPITPHEAVAHAPAQTASMADTAARATSSASASADDAERSRPSSVASAEPDKGAIASSASARTPSRASAAPSLPSSTGAHDPLDQY